MDDILQLADLQVATQKINTKIHSAEVHSYFGSHRKRRNEVLLAIDRQGINIYDVSHKLCQLSKYV